MLIILKIYTLELYSLEDKIIILKFVFQYKRRMMKTIISISGSNSSSSINRQLANYAASSVEGVNVKQLDLNDFEMPIYSTDREKADGFPQQAIDFVNEIRNSDGIVLSLAEYNGAYSGAFKNIFDWASRVEQKTFLGKPMLLMATSPGPRGGLTVLTMASDRFPRHEANITGQFSLPSFFENFKEGKIVNEELQKVLLEEIKKFEISVVTEIKQLDGDKKGEFYAEVNGEKKAQMTYSHAGADKFIIDHTEVDQSLQGQGVGYKLVDAAVNYARTNGLKIMPLCPFAAAVFRKKTDYKDVLF